MNQTTVAASFLAVIAALAMVAPGRARAAETAPIVRLPIVTDATSTLVPDVVAPTVGAVSATVAPLPVVGTTLAEITGTVDDRVAEALTPIAIGSTTAPITGRAPIRAPRPIAANAEHARDGQSAAPTTTEVRAATNDAFVPATPDTALRTVTVGTSMPSPSTRDATDASDTGTPSSSPRTADTAPPQSATASAVAPNSRGARPADDRRSDDPLTRDRAASPSSPPTTAPIASWGESIIPAIAWSSIRTTTSRPRGPPIDDVPVRPA